MAEDAPTVAARLSGGLTEIGPVLERYGFRLSDRDQGKSSGGYLATADFVRNDRSAHLWLRQQSLSVTYDIAGHKLVHGDYMRHLLGPGGVNRFPAFADDASESFRALRHDLEHHCRGFLEGDGSEYLRCWAAADEEAGLTGPQRLARIEAELRRH